MWKWGEGELDAKNCDARGLLKRVIKSNVSTGDTRWRGWDLPPDPPAPFRRVTHYQKYVKPVIYIVRHVCCTPCQ